MLTWRLRFLVWVVAVLHIAEPVRANSLYTFFGNSGQFVEMEPKSTAPNITFLDQAGRQHSLSEFRGKVVIVNIWATWCAPCVREMPALERLAEDLAGPVFDVIAISIDAGGVEAVRRFFETRAIDDLKLFVDPDRMTVFGRDESARDSALPFYGLPVSFFVDRDGNLVGYLVGAADWDAPEVRSFVEHFRRWRR